MDMEKIVSLDLKIFEKNFPKEWINELANSYSNFILQYGKSFSLANFHQSPGSWGSSPSNPSVNDLYLDKQISDYFERLLYLSNILILNYVLENLDKFQKLNFFDFGCGFGLLSIFLKKIGIKCYNYDNFRGIPSSLIKEDLFYKDYQVIGPSDVIPDNSIDVFACSGITPPIDTTKKFPKFMENNFKYLMLDSMCFSGNRGGPFFDLRLEIDFLNPWNKTDNTKNWGLADYFKDYKNYEMVEDNKRTLIIFKNKIFK